MKDFLEIKEISYGEFPEIFGLNKRFKPGGKKLKVVLDVSVPQSKKKINFSLVYRKLLKLLPTLEKHKCGENLFGDLKNHKEISSEKVEGITHIAHLMEHVIIDLQSNITKMNSCSGITCGYKNPEHRFDLFIECKDEKVGRFSVFFTVDLLKRLLLGKSLAKRHFRMIELVKYLRQNTSLSQKSELIRPESKIASDLGWTKRSVVSLLKGLKNFGLLESKRALPNLRNF
ncbi:MAG: hypothetical protein KAX39_03175 [candidate division Zixibacteria bacterium]|nr:hypothetical protein [candidate division Zixibacteria bacterium]